jgi:hypothetical protein
VGPKFRNVLEALLICELACLEWVIRNASSIQPLAECAEAAMNGLVARDGVCVEVIARKPLLANKRMYPLELRYEIGI